MLNLFTHRHGFNSTTLGWDHLGFLDGNISTLLHHLGGAGFFRNFLGNFLHHFGTWSLLFFSANLLLDVATFHSRDHCRHGLPKGESYVFRRWIEPTLNAHLTSSQTCSVTSSQDSTGTVMSVHSILGIGWHCFWFTWREKINQKIPEYYIAPQTIQHTTVHFFSMISFSTGLSTMLQTFFSWQAWTGVSWQVILGTWWQVSWN